jgi:hypothetical protein
MEDGLLTLDDRDSALDESNRDGTVAQHGNGGGNEVVGCVRRVDNGVSGGEARPSNAER